MKNISLLLLFFLSFLTNKKTQIESHPPHIEKILHISHTCYKKQGDIHPKLKEIPLINYNMCLLGGDLDIHTSADINNLKNWDTLFNFSAPSTLWSLGNHDDTNRDFIERFTKRPSFYSYTVRDIVFMVLDTEKNLSKITGEQLDMVKSVTDSLSKSNHLIVLTHKLLWLQGNEVLKSFLKPVPNGTPGDCDYCTNPNNFYEDIYPLLVNVQNKGIKVWCVAGDIGKNTSEFDYTLPEGIRLLASGLNLKKKENKVLVFEREFGEKELSVQFVNLEEL
jgi:hypothetical protein